MLLLTVVVALLAWRTWDRWGPVPERPVPVHARVRQWSATTCGPASVATLLNVYDRPWTLAALERDCRVTEGGSSLYDLRAALRQRGLRAEGLRATSPRALLRVPRPFIAYLASHHFVVVERVRGGRFDVFDPSSGGVRAWTPEQLHGRGGGWVLAVE